MRKTHKLAPVNTEDAKKKAQEKYAARPRHTTYTRAHEHDEREKEGGEGAAKSAIDGEIGGEERSLTENKGGGVKRERGGREGNVHIQVSPLCRFPPPSPRAQSLAGRTALIFSRPGDVVIPAREKKQNARRALACGALSGLTRFPFPSSSIPHTNTHTRRARPHLRGQARVQVKDHGRQRDTKGKTVLSEMDSSKRAAAGGVEAAFELKGKAVGSY